jgi:hypothetical protein
VVKRSGAHSILLKYLAKKGEEGVTFIIEAIDTVDRRRLVVAS